MADELLRKFEQEYIKSDQFTEDEFKDLISKIEEKIVEISKT